MSELAGRTTQVMVFEGAYVICLDKYIGKCSKRRGRFKTGIVHDAVYYNCKAGDYYR